MTINLNDTVKFKLTDYGKEIWYHQYDDLNKFFTIEPEYPKVDEDGYTYMQLWSFMKLYGKHIYMGSKNVIEPLELICERGKQNENE